MKHNIYTTAKKLIKSNISNTKKSISAKVIETKHSSIFKPIFKSGTKKIEINNRNNSRSFISSNKVNSQSKINKILNSKDLKPKAPIFQICQKRTTNTIKGILLKSCPNTFTLNFKKYKKDTNYDDKKIEDIPKKKLDFTNNDKKKILMKDHIEMNDPTTSETSTTIEKRIQNNSHQESKTNLKKNKQKKIKTSRKISLFEIEEDKSNFLNSNLGLEENYSFSSFDNISNRYLKNNNINECPNPEFEFVFENNQRVNSLVKHRVLNSIVNNISEEKTIDTNKLNNNSNINELDNNESINKIYVGFYQSNLIRKSAFSE